MYFLYIIIKTVNANNNTNYLCKRRYNVVQVDFLGVLHFIFIILYGDINTRASDDPNQLVTNQKYIIFL